jgi:Protein of unknown function (DUF1194)
MFRRLLALTLAGLAAGAVAVSSVAEDQVAVAEVDTALVVSVDVSNSVDERRYQLQMEGIAAALEDDGVIDAILSGPQGGIAFAMVSWADKPKTTVPWAVIRSKDDAAAVAKKIRMLPRDGGEFTCLAGMLRNVADKLVTQIPVKASRIVIDVSGDGADNCNATQPAEEIRDELVNEGVTINGLPILEGDQKATLEKWYTDKVRGGPSGFVLPAIGFDDFPRAIRQKFVIEMSWNGLSTTKG